MESKEKVSAFLDDSLGNDDAVGIAIPTASSLPSESSRNALTFSLDSIS